MKKSLIVIILLLLLLVAPAAALTDKTTNGDFEDGLTGWDIIEDTTYSATANVYTNSVAGIDGSSCVWIELYSGETGGIATGGISQVIGSGTITQISFYYKYRADIYVEGSKQSYDRNPGQLDIVWGGDVIDTISLTPTSGTSWTQRTINLPNAEPIDSWLTFQASATTSGTGTEYTTRSASLYLDNIEILSSGTPPIISGITQSPATSSGDKEPAPATITFTAQMSQGSDPITYRWDFDNDGTYDATGRTATYTYAQPGTYTCQLVVNNGEGATTASTTVYVDNPLPQGDFYASPTSGNVPLNVQFILTAYGDGETYQWWFGDGNDVGDSPDSTQSQPNHTYTEEGTYTVTCIITNSVGSVTLTKSQLITVNPEGTTSTSTGIGSIYAPHSVQMIFTDAFGVPVNGLDVTFVQKTSSGNFDEILKWFGITNPAAITGNQRATTSEDGSISWLALPQIQYEVSYIWEGKTYSFLIYPQETVYKIRVGQLSKPTEVVGVLAELEEIVSDDYSEISLSLKYYYEDTNNVYFWVREGDELIYSQTFSGNRVVTSVDVPNTRGTQYFWGYNASLTDGTSKIEYRKVEATGDPRIPLWDLGIQNYGYGLEWYMYIAFGITLLVASLFSFTTAKMGGVVVGLFLSSLFIFVGWIPTMYAPMVSLAAGIAMIAAANKDGREIGFNSIILLLALSGAVIGLVNDINLFGMDFSSPNFTYNYSLESFATATDTNIVTATSILTILGTMGDMISGALTMLVFAAPLLIDLGMTVELAAVLQVAIYIVVLMWFVHDLLPRLRG